MQFNKSIPEAPDLSNIKYLSAHFKNILLEVMIKQVYFISIIE
jgi:hypothetical protein